MMETYHATDESTPPSSVSRIPDQSPSPALDNDFNAALARLIDRAPGAVPDDVIHTYANLRRTQRRVRQLIEAAKRRIATDERKIEKVRAECRDMLSQIDAFSADIAQKQQDIRRYQDAISAARYLQSLIEYGAFCPKRPNIVISSEE